MLLEPFQFFEPIRPDPKPVHQELLESLAHGPLGDVGVEPLAGLDQRREHPHGAFCGQTLHLPDDGRKPLLLHRQIAPGTGLHAEFGKKQPQEVIHLRHGRHGGFAAAPRDALLNGHAGGQPGDEIHLGLFELLNELPRIRRHAVQEPPLAFRKKQVKRERRFPRAAQPGDDHHLVVRNPQVEVLQVVLARPVNLDRALPRSVRRRGLLGRAQPRERGVLARGVPEQERPQETPRVGFLVPGDLLGRALGNQPAPARARIGPEIQEVIGAFDDLEVVLDHQQAVPGVHQAVQGADQQSHVVKMQPRGGLVENEQRRAVAPAGEPLHQFEPLGFPAGEHVERLAQGEIAQTHLLQHRQRLHHLGSPQPGEKPDRLAHRHRKHVVDGFAGVPAQEQLQQLRPVTFAVAFRAPDKHVAQKLHLDFLKPAARAAFTTARAGVERKRAGREPARQGIGRAGKELADRVKDPEIHGRTRTRRPGKRRLIDHHHLLDRFVAEDRPAPAHPVLGREAFGGLQVLEQHLVHQGALARSGHAADAGKNPERKIHVDVLQVVLRGTFHREKPARAFPMPRHGDGFPAREIVRRQRAADFGPRGFERFFRGLAEQTLQRSAVNQVPAGVAPARPDFDHVIGGPDDGFLVFDHQERVAFVAQAFEHADQPARVARMQSDAGFIEHEECVDQGGAEAGGEVDPLNLAAAQGAGRAVQAQIVEAHLQQKPEPGTDFAEQKSGGGVGIGLAPPGLLKHPGEIADGQRHEFRQGLPAQPEVERGRLETPAVAGGAGGVSPVTAQQHPHMHFVGFALQPVEKAFHPVPQAFFPQLFPGLARAFAEKHPALIGLGELGKGRFDVELSGRRTPQQVPLALRAVLGLEGFDGALSQTQASIGNRAVQVDRDRAAKPAASRAGAHGMVETEQPGGGRSDVHVAVGAMPARGKGHHGVRQKKRDLSLSKPEGRLHRLAQARPVFFHHADPVLDHPHHGGQLPQRAGFIGAQDLAVDFHPQVTLLLEELEKFRGRRLVRHRDRETHEHSLARQRPAFRGLRKKRVQDGARRFRADLALAGGAESLDHAGQEQLEVVVDLRDRADGGAGGFDRVGLLDGNGRGDPADFVHLGLVHPLQELPGVG